MADCRRVGPVLCPDFDFMGLAVASAFALASKFADRAIYEVRLLSGNGGPVRSDWGADVVTEPLADPAAFDTLRVARGIQLPKTTPDLHAPLQAAARSTRRRADLCLGAFHPGRGPAAGRSAGDRALDLRA